MFLLESFDVRLTNVWHGSNGNIYVQRLNCEGRLNVSSAHSPIAQITQYTQKYLMTKCEFQFFFLFEQIRKRREEKKKKTQTVNQSFHLISFCRLFSIGFVNGFHHSMPLTLTVYVNISNNFVRWKAQLRIIISDNFKSKIVSA